MDALTKVLATSDLDSSGIARLAGEPRASMGQVPSRTSRACGDGEPQTPVKAVATRSSQPSAHVSWRTAKMPKRFPITSDARFIAKFWKAAVTLKV